MKLVSIPKSLSDVVAEVSNYLDTSQLAYNVIPPFKKISDGDALANDLPLLFAMLADMNLTVKSLYLFSMLPQEVIGSSLGQLIILPVKNFQDASMIIHELSPNAIEQLSIYTGSPYWELEDATETESMACEPDKLFLFDSTAQNPAYISSRYANPSLYEVKDLGLFLNIYVNEDLSSYFAV